MAVTVNMPQLGESVTEGTIARWLKQPGEAVAKYESIAEVITDKVNAEIPAPADGTMGEIVAPEGTVVAVGQPICTIDSGASGQPEAASAPPTAAPQPAAESAHQSQEADAGAQAAPAPQERSQPAGAAPARTEEQQAQPAAEQQPAETTASLAQPAAEPQQAAATASPAQPEQQQAPPPDQQQAGAMASQAQSAARQGTEPTVPEAGGSNGGAAGEGYHLTPAVRMLVREHDVDLRGVQGSGLGGRITKKDVLEHVQQRDAGRREASPAADAAAQPSPAPEPVTARPAAPTPSPTTAAQAPSSPPSPAPAPTETGDTLVPMTPIRRSIAEHMVRSKQTSPHAWMMMEVDMSAVFRLRAARKEEFKRRYGVSLTFLPFVARATVEALRRHPSLNAQWSDQGVILKHDIHLGIAVALEENLIVPVVRNADRLSIAGLAQTMADLGDRARANRLKLDEIQGGTFTLNNTGALGTVMTQAIINQPQAAILAMDAVIKRPVVVEDDAIAVRPIMNLGLSFDHRLNDGLQATRFLKEVKDILENLDDGADLL